ncbi:MAG: NTP transferase domain-containing protein [Erythrobacter sp.]|uniref:phosphocholine cytidylyltransferase family protein n=1 Tax=Erythrobacter sp. TaxID=1042 RepID=UPI003265393B
MDGLILAAGFGSRLRSLFPSKPLALIRGVPLLEIAVRQLVSGGVARVVVVTGYNAEVIEEAAANIAARVPCEIVTTRVQDWEKPNGYSVMAGARLIEGNYLLVMCDHLLSTPIIKGLAGVHAKDRGVTLAIDRGTSSSLIDLDDATWVETYDNGFIARIGKGLAKYDAVDCGAFLATPALAQAIEEMIDQGKPGSLSDGMQLLADRGQAATLDVSGAWWMDVDDPKAHGQAEQLLDEGFSLLSSAIPQAAQPVLEDALA